MTVTQDQFTAAVLDPSASVPATLIGPDGGPAARRFDVYRNNVAVSLTEADGDVVAVHVKAPSRRPPVRTDQRCWDAGGRV